VDSPQSEHARWFSEEVLPHNTQLRAYLRGAFPSVRDVDDVVQESYLRVWRRQLARPIESAKAFLFQVARRHALDTVRRDRASPFDATVDLARHDAPEETADTASAAAAHEEAELLFAAIDALPARCREIVILRKIDGLSQKEIAHRLGLAESTVQVQASRGLRRCAEYLRARGVGSTAP
jgi:RNA polymerase sigma factor (sigma-70 family)